MINGKLSDALAALYDGSLLSIEVPEWNDILEDGRLYYSPLTLKEKQRLQPWADKNDAQMYVELIILKAKNASGEHLFDTGARALLMETVPCYILERIGLDILTVPEPEDLKKSSNVTLT